MEITETNRCLHCEGRGYHWKRGEIISHRTGVAIADFHTRGATCEVCHGTGKPPSLMTNKQVIGKVAALAVIGWLGYFVLMV